MKTMVVNCKRSVYDIYVGRGSDPITGLPSKWGNPFVVGKDGNRMECLRKHKAWIIKQPELMASLHELTGKRLGCWCKPLACHGETLAKLADASVLVNKKRQKNLFE
jgi:hypothetical protein